ncbi:Putative F0F1-ATPase subunit (ATPase_gene1) [Fusobacterium necrogenes]|uniref:F0F1-ATPase subunit (ATPase_gene1) n=2 Tax=Fusobacterium necrogenes TaxID=858 RepID=A0A377GZ77_9FUSO|nr:Putative F0F1-ATPase subunit (ATPase_gene1) [Fusobacterium necrogenes]
MTIFILYYRIIYSKVYGKIMKFDRWITKDIIHALSLLSYLGFLIVGNILLYIAIYKLIEKYLFKSTILFIIFVMVGIISGFYNAYVAIMKK